MARQAKSDYKIGMATESTEHRRLACGVELAVLPLEGRRTVAYEIRVLAGISDEPEELGGLARIVEETISKGTQQRSAQELTDAFDALGAQVSSGVGRESMVFRCSCLPEYLDHALGLHAEMLRTPIFPEEYCEVAVELAIQDLLSLEDEPGELARKLIGPHAYGPRLGRHELGCEESLRRIRREQVVDYWKHHFTARRLQISLGGAVDIDKASARIDQLFTGFDSTDDSTGNAPGTTPGRAAEFTPGAHHHHKELEQQHILICWPGVAVRDDAYPVERIALGVLGEGMSSRLFTEVREKQGLVYWVGAWDEHPRSGGRLFMGASTMPARCDQTYRTLLREVDRLEEDVTAEEIERAKISIIAKTQTHGDITRARVSELSSDLYFHGRPVSIAEKNAKLSAVTVEDVRKYLRNHPRDRLCVLTLGPRPLEGVV